ncbi:hypothetical protein SAMN04244548_03660 [Paracoccus pantotrophus]|nr:hypothetical protein SAMN04244548_03660 [Paracoccus pantotrophus]
MANVRWGQCDCAGCGQSWTAKPSYVYLLDIRHAGTNRHYLKVGYSSHPVKRHKHQLGLPKDVDVEVLRVVAMPTGHDACAMEKAAHARLRRDHPEAVAPQPEYADLMNVVSEIYRPQALAILHDTLDRIEREVATGACIRTPNDLSEQGQIAGGNNPETPHPDPESRTPTDAATRNPEAMLQDRAAAWRDRLPILDRHWGLTG